MIQYIDLLIYRIYETEDHQLSRMSHMKRFFDDYEFSVFGYGLNTTSFIKNDGWTFWYYDMPSIIHLVNDLGLVPVVFIATAFLFLFNFLMKKKDQDAILILLSALILSITSSNPTTPANTGFYITFIGLFTIINKYLFTYRYSKI